MYEYLRHIIALGGYNLENLEKVIERHFINNEITAEQEVELLNLAAENADDSKQFDIATAIAELDRRIAVLEAAGVVVWTSGHVTARGETVLYDIIKEGHLRYCRYDGGRQSTSLSPGKIEGWVILSGANGEVTHTVQKDESGNIILVPVNNEPEA